MSEEGAPAGGERRAAGAAPGSRGHAFGDPQRRGRCARRRQPDLHPGERRRQLEPAAQGRAGADGGRGRRLRRRRPPDLPESGGRGALRHQLVGRARPHLDRPVRGALAECRRPAEGRRRAGAERREPPPHAAADARRRPDPRRDHHEPAEGRERRADRLSLGHPRRRPTASGSRRRCARAAPTCASCSIRPASATGTSTSPPSRRATRCATTSASATASPCRDGAPGSFSPMSIPRTASSSRHGSRRRWRPRSDWNFECRVIWPDGSIHWIEVHGAIYRSGEEPARMLGTIVDVTGRKSVEEALRSADRSKDEFLATLAHELRNPLAPIRNALEIMRLTREPQTARQRPPHHRAAAPADDPSGRRPARHQPHHPGQDRAPAGPRSTC